MAENDIYNNEKRYKSLMENYEELSLQPDKRKTIKKGLYICKNRKNLKYFKDLFHKFESKDLSYVRRLRLLQGFIMILHATNKDLASCTRKDLDKIVAFMHTRYKSSKSKSDFIRDTKYMWKILFPEKDERGRPDETMVPYAVRHLSPKIDRSKETRRDDKLTFAEYKQIVSYFAQDKRLQAYITFAVESLARPQELMYTKIRDYEFYDNFAKVWISSHGKEGTGLLQCFESFPYVLAWYQQHPLKQDKDAYFFLNTGSKARNKQMTPPAVNKQLRKACKDLNIDKKITCYSLKRNGVTFDLMSGKKPQEIQMKARWTSLKQLQTYSKLSQEDAFNLQGIRTGKIKDPEIIKQYQGLLPDSDKRSTKTCPFCNQIMGFEEEVCPRCQRLTDRDKLKEQVESHSRMQQEIKDLKEKLNLLLKYAEWTRKNNNVKSIIEKESS